MKHMKLVGILVVLVVLAVAVNPVSAQLGDTDTSTFTVQNVSGGDATVTVTFYNESGTSFVPTDLGSGTTNPFTLANGASKQVNVAQIPTAQLPSGRYSLVISSTAQVIAQAGLAGSGSLRFGGSYISFSEGAQTIYIPTAAYNLYGWYSMFTVQNIGSGSTNVTVTIKCLNGSTGTLTKTGLASMASVTWALKSVVPTGFTTATQCDGSAVVTSTAENVVAINNQNNPSSGATNSFEGAATGSSTLYVANLSSGFFGWNSNLTIVKMDAGNTTVTVTYSDGATASVCNLTDATPFCKLYQPTAHPTSGRYGATITSSPSNHLQAIIGSTNGSLSGAVSAVSGGTATVAIPNAAKAYYGWNSAINCQVVGGGATSLHMSYSGYEGSAYNTETLSIGGSKQILVASESFLPASWQGGVTITANNTSAQVACTVGNTSSTGPATLAGDWTTQYNAYNK
jgi:hypothetical protein